MFMEEPVIICEYSSEWINLFEKEKKSILNTVGEYTNTIEHIGSTAIEGLAAKPIIDILVGLNSLEDAKDCIPKLEELNYEYVQEVELILPYRRFFRKPPKSTAERKYHIHMVEINSDFWIRQLLFRDYLRSNPKILQEYETIKKLLAKKYPNNRGNYNMGKEGFVLLVVEKAKQETKK